VGETPALRITQRIPSPLGLPWILGAGTTRSSPPRSRHTEPSRPPTAIPTGHLENRELPPTSLQGSFGDAGSEGKDSEYLGCSDPHKDTRHRLGSSPPWLSTSSLGSHEDTCLRKPLLMGHTWGLRQGRVCSGSSRDDGRATADHPAQLPHPPAQSGPAESTALSVIPEGA